jgi:hypothetical protein
MKKVDPALLWEPLNVAHGSPATPESATEFLTLAMYRAKVPGGWLLLAKVTHGISVSFYPDAGHVWDGYSL